MEKELIEQVLNKHVHPSSDAINAELILDCNINFYCHGKGCTCEKGSIIKPIYLTTNNGPQMIIYNKDKDDGEVYIDISKIDFFVCFSDEALTSRKAHTIANMLFGGK